MKRISKRVLSLLCAVTLFLAVVPMSASVTAATSYVFFENFQSYNTDEMPEGWSVYNADGDSYCWAIERDYNGDVSFVSNSLGTLDADEYLMMPAVTVPADVESEYYLMFDHRNTYPFGGGAEDAITIYASKTPITDPALLTDDQIVYDGSFYPGSVEWTTEMIDLSACKGNTWYFAFRHRASKIWQFEMDNVAIACEEADRFYVEFDVEEDVIAVTPVSGTFEVIDGQDFSFTVEVREGFHRENGTLSVTLNGNELVPENGVYTLKNVTAHQEVVIDFAYAAGDATGDGYVTLQDAVNLFYAVNGAFELDPVSEAAGNIDTYAVFDLRDALALYNYIAGLRDYIDEYRDPSLLWETVYADSANGFKSATSCKDAEYFLDRREVKDHSAAVGDRDGKTIFYTANKARVVNLSDGYAFTMPFTDFEADYSLSALRSRYESESFVLNVSKENKNPYGNNASGWNTYLTEWVNRYIADDSFLNANDLSRTRITSTSTTALSGYTVITYNIAIDDAKDIDMPYYSIAIVRKSTEYVKFHLFVLKSTTNQAAAMDTIVKSFKEFTAVGVSKNEEVAFECKPDRNWNDETAAYYQKLMTQNETDWGFFTESMADTSEKIDRIDAEYADLSSRLDFEYDVMPNYMHIGWGNTLSEFPTMCIDRFAGGNGFNGKPVLQFTYQFTTSNNTRLNAYTPMFDVARGNYDDAFRDLAQNIKLYGKPVLFRLNNEMNTDWTSYSGIVNLLDPDLFAITWERLYRIFEEEGVDNCIWIFNPIHGTTPYSSWGEYLCYLPDIDTVHALGLTSYEMGNDSYLKSFQSMYTDLYKKNTPYFDNYPHIISEFGAGAGGEKQYNWSAGRYLDTTLGRNSDKQAQWVKDMFTCLEKRDEKGYEFCRNIKVAVWFAVNDYVNIDGTDYVSNYFELNTNVAKTVSNFKDGLAKHP